MECPSGERGQPFLQSVREGRYEEAQRALDACSALERDDVSLELVGALSDEELARMAGLPEGNLLLERLFDELTSGHVSEDELRQAQRLLAVEVRRRYPTPDDFARAVPRARVFPHESMGISNAGAPVTARRRRDGAIEVHLTARSFGYRQEAATLPGADDVLEPDEVVGVRLYDEGGTGVYVPALYLLLVSNADDAHLAGKLLEAGVLGLTVGACSPGVAAEATGTARVLAMCDRTAMVLGVALSLALEHRSWVLSRFGEDGRAFLYRMEVLDSALALYGVVRVAMAAPLLVKAVRTSYRDFAAKAALQRQQGKLTPQDASRLDSLQEGTDRLLGELAALPPRDTGAGANASANNPLRTGGKVIPFDRPRQPGGRPEAGAQSLPAEARESLAPTGTDGPLPGALRGHSPTADAPAASIKRPGQGGPPESRRGQASPPGASASPVRQAPSSFRSASRPASPAGPGERPAGTRATEREPPALEVLPGGLDLEEELTLEQLIDFKVGELESKQEAGERLSGGTSQVRKLRPASPPPGVSGEDPTWQKYLGYFERRLARLQAHDEGQLANRPHNPLMWDRYERLHGDVARGIALEKRVRESVLAERALPDEQREFTRGIQDPRTDWNLGLRKDAENTKYVDGFISGRSAGDPEAESVRVSISCKSHNFKKMTTNEAAATAWRDYSELVEKYGGTAEVRRPGHPLFGQKVEITRLHLVYDAEYMTKDASRAILERLSNLPVEVHFK